MLRRALILSAPLALIAGSARAAGGAAKTDQEPIGPWVDLLPVGLPVVVNGELVNYVFVYVRIKLTRSANAPKLREREPYFRDALVRAGHRTPFTRPDSYTSLDAGKIAQVMQREAGLIASPKDIAGIVVLRQMPKRQSNLPRPRKA
ncbi:MAG: hypothetical protein WCY15_08720 [Phenylobacterium sp.]|jgi:hypothetical protein|uniref:hypothetical protein n=1 Tax=Phenylobacterium sp. TaxID=1871053 RepID=UPI002A3697EB|nr:hypothetical protein [Phenylobacterium sp.]MDX9999059.1 hypothetical protein [Phenylobacterium sp.]